MQSDNKWYTLSSFKLKIAAFLFMTIDHIGLLLSQYMYYNNVASTVGTVFRYIGRLAMPLFAFMIVEGVVHTKSYKKYATRLGLMAAIITAALLSLFILEKTGSQELFKALNINPADLKMLYNEGNIFLDLLLGSFLVWSLMNKNNKIKLLSLIPFAISILSFIAKILEANQGIQVYWYPAFLRLQYDWISVVLIGLFYLAKVLTKVYYKYQRQVTGIDDDIWKENGQYHKMENIIACGMLVIFSAIYFGITYIVPKYGTLWDPGMQSCMAAAGAFILLYNGTRGYNKKWFQIFSYWYYPLHLIVIGGIFLLVFGL